ncbi:MAG: hypothetical protein ACRCS8_05050 [Brevinema sp.]
MKTFFIRLKIFLNQPSVKGFLDRFILIFVFIFMATLTATVMYFRHQSSESRMQRELQRLFEEPRKFHRNTRVEYDNIPLHRLPGDPRGVEHFWEPTGTDIRYTLPKHGKPTQNLN